MVEIIQFPKRCKECKAELRHKYDAWGRYLGSWCMNYEHGRSIPLES